MTGCRRSSCSPGVKRRPPSPCVVRMVLSATLKREIVLLNINISSVLYWCIEDQIGCGLCSRWTSFSNKNNVQNPIIFTVEVHRVYLAVDHIIQCKAQQSIIYTDLLILVVALPAGKVIKNPIFAAPKALYRAQCVGFLSIVALKAMKKPTRLPPE